MENTVVGTCDIIRSFRASGGSGVRHTELQLLDVGPDIQAMTPEKANRLCCRCRQDLWHGAGKTVNPG